MTKIDLKLNILTENGIKNSNLVPETPKNRFSKQISSLKQQNDEKKSTQIPRLMISSS